MKKVKGIGREMICIILVAIFAFLVLAIYLIILNSKSILDAIFNIPMQPVIFLIIGIIGGHLLTVLIYNHSKNDATEEENDYDYGSDSNNDNDDYYNKDFHQFNHELKPREEESV